MENWIGTRYHQPSDELTDDWDFTGMIQDARLGFFAGLMVADADEMPSLEPGRRVCGGPSRGAGGGGRPLRT